MKLFVIGNDGMLGQDMVRIAREAGHEVFGATFPAIDITKPESVREQMETERPDAVINCAAYTAVDACETERETAFAVNATGAGIVAGCAEAIDIPVVHFSTDYVFDGKGTKPYVETDPTGPASVYGQSKLRGETLVQEKNTRAFILRIAWLYGTNGKNFVKTMRALGKKSVETGKPVRVVNDQFGSPTYTVDVCRQTLRLLSTSRYGLYHSTNRGVCTWFDFAKEIMAAAGIPCIVEPSTTVEFSRAYPQSAPRPAWSVLENRNLNAIGMNGMRPWKQAFEAFSAER
jgi:dTDP-4-dehydrorhamnose reductase